MTTNRFAVLVLAALLGSACENYANVPPNDIGMVLTPTGYEDRVYTPGQVDLGVAGQGGQGNRLVLLQRSGVQIKEPFIGPETSADKEDHRCLTANRAPMSLDVRLLFALPDYEKEEGKKILSRIFHLGNPKEEPEASPKGRVLRISAESIYADQAQQQVRGKIRQICASYPDFDTAFASFGSDGENSLTHRINRAIATVLREQNVPLSLVDAFVSNMKPDKSIVDAISANGSANKRIEAIKTLADFLNADPTGTRLMVYRMQAIQEIVATGGANGHNTVYMTDVGAAVAPHLLPVPHGK